MANVNLSAVAVGVYTALNVASMIALVSTRVFDQTPRNPVYPYVDYNVSKQEHRGLGAGELAEVRIRVSVLSKSDTGQEGQTICAKVEDLLKDQPLTITGYKMAGLVTWQQTIDLGDVEINGEKVHEWVLDFLAWVEPSA